MATADNAERNGPTPEDPAEMRKQLRRLLMRSHPDTMGESRARAEETTKTLIALLDATKLGRAPRTWDEVPESNQPAQFREGQPAHFVRREENGGIHELAITLPKWTKAFRSALEAFLAGASDDDVRTILTFDPIAADRNARRELSAQISAARNVPELLAAQESVQRQNLLLPITRQKLLREIIGRIASVYTPSIHQTQSLANLSSLSDDVRQIITTASIAAEDDKQYFLNVLAMIADIRAEAIGSTMLEDGDAEKKLGAIGAYITAVSAFPFSNTQKKDDLLRAGNKMAHDILMESMKRLRSEKGLERLHEYVSRFPFSLDDAGEAARSDLHNWIEKKWQSYFSPEAKESQVGMTSVNEQTK
ncbi:MAG: hypothetical protein AAB605_01990 [Patescibacteria group bacterium]